MGGPLSQKTLKWKARRTKERHEAKHASHPAGGPEDGVAAENDFNDQFTALLAITRTAPCAIT
jgi:hypothetical protein